MSDLISAQESVAKIVDTAIRKILSGEQKLTKEYEQSVIEAVDEILNTARRERGKVEAQAEIVRCKDCKHRIEHRHYGDMSESAYTCEGNMDGWILPDSFCSWAERRTDEGD